MGHFNDRREFGSLRASIVASVFAGVAMVGIARSAAGATIEVNLVAAGSYALNADGQGANFYTNQQQPTGTGVIQPFLTIQRNGYEHGYNTDGVMEFDQKRQPGWTRSLLLNEIEPVSMTVNGQTNQYIKFLLDINEPNGGGNALLSLNVLQLFVTNDANIFGYQGYSPIPGSNFTTGAGTDGFSNATKVYDLDALQDYTVNLNYDNASGSGSGDLYVYIPYSVIAGRTETNLVLYSSFGVPDQSGAGFEEWAVSTQAQSLPETAVPLPPVALGGIVLMGATFLKRLRSRTSLLGFAPVA